MAGRLTFAAIAGPHGRAHAEAAGIDPDNPATILLVAGGRVYGHSDAVLRALALVKAPWPFISRIARLIPRGLRDGVYAYVARRRYRWFGRACLIPDAAWAARVLD